MKIAVIGCGLGYSLACILAIKGFNVLGIDTNQEAFNHPRLDAHTEKYFDANNIAINKHVRFETEYRRVTNRGLVFIFVSTPIEDGRISIKHVRSAILDTLQYNPNAIFALLSTMPIGGCARLFAETPKLVETLTYAPPTVRSTMLLETFTKPPAGFQMMSTNAEPSKLKRVYNRLLDPSIPIIYDKYQVVEAAKLLINLFLTCKIVFGNAVEDWAREHGLNAHRIMRLVGKDMRIGSQYLIPNGAAGGPCFPRDMIELASASENTPLSKLVLTLKELNDQREKTSPSLI